jgi:pyrroline-5-carboxylate reductase
MLTDVSAAYGFVGAGEITAAMVEGLSADVVEPPAIFLSPRNYRVGRELSGRFANVRVCGSNQEVLDSTQSVVVAVRPPMAGDVLTELSFGPQHVVISVMAGVPLAQLRTWAAPADHLVRAIPLPPAAGGGSLTAMYPDDAVARDLFERVGGVLVPSNEATLDALNAATATFAAHLDYLTTIADWLTDQGLDTDVASAYITHIFGRLGQSMLDRNDSLAGLTDKHTTPGGLNEQVMADLRRDGVPDTVRRALDRVLARLRD